MTTPIIEKIKKLRALATSSNVNEAAAAAAAAERLIQEHAISEEELASKPDDEAVVEFPGALFVFKSARPPVWQQSLVAGLAKQYRCAGWLTYARGCLIYRATGRPSDLDILKYQAAFFVTEISRLMHAHCKGMGRTAHNSFAWGAVTAVLTAMKETNQAVRATATSTALARVDAAAEAALALRDTICPDLRTKSVSKTRLDGDAYAAGKRAGAGINQRSQFCASGTKLLGGG